MSVSGGSISRTNESRTMSKGWWPDFYTVNDFRL
jgi:hypothetical protein